MQITNLTNPNTPLELNLEQLDEVGGGAASAEWGVSTGIAAAFTVGAATVTAPVVAGALAVGGVLAAGMAVYYAIADGGASFSG